MKKIVLFLCMLVLLAACGNESDKNEVSKGTDTNADEYANFQNIDIEMKGNQAVVTGEVDASDNKFYYHLEQNENIIIEEQQIEVEGKWGEFNITFDLPEETEEVLIVKMYTKGKDGSIVNPNYIPIDVNLEKTEQQ